MFRQMAKRRENLKKPVIAIGIGVPKGGSPDEPEPLEEFLDEGPVEEELEATPLTNVSPEEAKKLAAHHQELADEYRAKAEAEAGPAAEETGEESAPTDELDDGYSLPEEEEKEEEGKKKPFGKPFAKKGF